VEAVAKAGGRPLVLDVAELQRGPLAAADPRAGADRVEQIAWSGRHPAIAVNLHGRGPQSHRLLLPLGAARVLAYAHPEVPEIEGPDRDPGEHEVIRWCRLVGAYGLDADPADLALGVPAAVPRQVVLWKGRNGLTSIRVADVLAAIDRALVSR
jgi:hypothetical protein